MKRTWKLQYSSGFMVAMQKKVEITMFSISFRGEGFEFSFFC